MPKPRQSYSYVDDWKSLWEPDLEAIAYNGSTCDPTRVDPKVLQWVKQNCSHKPHFIKIVNMNAAIGRPGLKNGLRNASCCQLSVPSPFVKEHFRELQRVVMLENDEGKTWRVSFGAAKADPSWRQGWNRVSADNDLEPGEVIVFVLVANSRFHFTRFDEDGNLISRKSDNFTPNVITVVKNPEESLQYQRTSWKSKRAAAMASRINHCTKEAECPKPAGLGFDDQFHEAPQLLDSADKQIAHVSNTRRRLCKMGEIKSKANSNNKINEAIINGLSHDSEEAGSTLMADSPSPRSQL